MRMMIARSDHAHFTCVSSSSDIHSRRLLHQCSQIYQNSWQRYLGQHVAIQAALFGTEVRYTIAFLRLLCAARSLAMPTCRTKTPAPPPIATLFSAASPDTVFFHDCGCQNLEGGDSRAKGTMLSRVESARGGCICPIQLKHTISVIVGGH